jgi:hypothetical protein
MIPNHAMMMRRTVTAALVAISNQTINDALNLGAQWRLRSTGVAEWFTEQEGSFVAITGEWRLSGATADYEIRYTLNSGNAPTIVAIPALSSGVWSAFNSGASFQLLGGSLASNFTINLRLAADPGTILDTAVIILDTTA